MLVLSWVRLTPKTVIDPNDAQNKAKLKEIRNLSYVDLRQTMNTVRYMSNYEDANVAVMALKFKALATPVRLKIFNELMRCCSPGTSCDIQRCIGDLAGLVDVAPSTLSHHMKALKDAGLVDMQRDGKRILCRVNTKNLAQLSNYFNL